MSENEAHIEALEARVEHARTTRRVIHEAMRTHRALETMTAERNALAEKLDIAKVAAVSGGMLALVLAAFSGRDDLS